jgi:hypothetical protein
VKGYNTVRCDGTVNTGRGTFKLVQTNARVTQFQVLGYITVFRLEDWRVEEDLNYAVLDIVQKEERSYLPGIVFAKS